jgi:hypothetical protein
MKLKKTHSILAILFLLAAIGRLQAQSNAQKDEVLQKLYVNPTYAHGGVDSQFFRSIKFIPLETKKESVFGRIAKLEITDDYYIISDGGTNSILLFKKDGSFFSKIEGSKYSNGRLNTDFAVDREHQLIITSLSSMQGKLIWFDYTGKIVKQTAMPESYYSISSLNSSSLVYSPFTFMTKGITRDSINYFIKNTDGLIGKPGLLPFKVSQYALSPNVSVMDIAKPYQFYYSGVKGNLLFVANYEYNIYNLTDQGLRKTYKVIFPQELSLQVDSLSARLSLVDKEKYIRDNSKKIYTFRGVYQLGSSLYFETVKSSFYNTDPYLVYNLKNGNLISLKKVSSGSASYFLPLTTDFGSIVGCDGEYIYSSVSSLEMFEAKDAALNKNPNYPAGLKTYFSTQSRKSNPVLILLKPNENL